jgi:hypothetical protein
MDDGMEWAAHQMAGRSLSYAYSLPGFPKAKCRNKAIDSITDEQNPRPAIVGFGSTPPHYCLAYAYLYRDRRTSWHTTIYRQRWFLCNWGEGENASVYKNARVWYGTDADFWHIM